MKEDTTFLMSLPQTLARIPTTTVADHRDITSNPRYRPCLQELQLYKVDASFPLSGRRCEKTRVGLEDTDFSTYQSHV
jgi:hypothetical protein